MDVDSLLLISPCCFGVITGLRAAGLGHSSRQIITEKGFTSYDSRLLLKSPIGQYGRIVGGQTH
jgi:hypothetical protein